MTAAVFIDRDGTITHDIGYAHKIGDFKLLPNAVKGLKLLRNFKIFIVTNQSGIGKGFFTLKEFFNYNKEVLAELKKHNIKIEKTYYCPHKPEDNCSCRKPKTKFLKVAEKKFRIDLKKSFVIGDKKADVELGKNANCKSILVLTGDGKKTIKEAKPDFIAKDLMEAAKWIVKNDNQ
ncbi:HAD family hydrolase [Candidatus Woesearchaeota archaeon]|nr:HAD family hydrolase [Candidatus Woesearchaeota archaeon]